MGILDRIRSGFRAIGERLHLIEKKVDESHATRKEKEEIQRSISFMERKVERMEKEIRPGPELVIKERISIKPSIRPKRYRVAIQYRPVGVSRDYRYYEWEGDADSAEEAIAFTEEGLPDEPDYYLSIEAERVE